jgi:hypothetical protein
MGLHGVVTSFARKNSAGIVTQMLHLGLGLKPARESESGFETYKGG